MAAKKKRVPVDPFARVTSDRIRVKLTFVLLLPEPSRGIPPGVMTLMKRINAAASAVVCQAGMSERELNESRFGVCRDTVGNSVRKHLAKMAAQP